MQPELDSKKQILELLELFESEKHSLQKLPAVGKKNLLFGDVVILNLTEEDWTQDQWIPRRIVRTSIPQIFTWLFKHFVPILRAFPNYSPVKEEVFGRLGNTVNMVERELPDATPDEKVAAVIQDLWEICQDMAEGRIKALAVAVGADVLDDFITRSIKSGYVDQATFEEVLFGERA